MNTAKFLHRSCVACLALGSALLVGTALAAEPPADASSPRGATVRYGDLNLVTVAGATTLYRRIQGAARFLCGESGRSLDDQREWKACYRGAVDEAVIAVDNPTLTAVHQGREAPVSAMLAP